ncbi:unnamed protein product [Spirodela intermedia]|uniref:Uncharacterized protein n=2 Tax=Spirodela intermedia TaxID=51605 RepID=A0A7I8KEF7_SPIIN|nr:unnamed protein product [Spirodela intermedia]CAA6659296.1 unnamed protein product [Spirodela intermedia]CAA7395604.1 unnamed protein product [Spirodela intermedia]
MDTIKPRAKGSTLMLSLPSC